jgi:hypothetical protein
MDCAACSDEQPDRAVTIGYYDALAPVVDLGDDQMTAISGIRLPFRTMASIDVPGGRIVVALLSDSSRLSRMFAAHWGPAADREPDATLYALAEPAFSYGLGGAWDGARWWSRSAKAMVVFGFGTYRMAKVCVRGICSAVSGDDMIFVHGCTLSVGAGTRRRGVIIAGASGAGKTTLVASLLQRAEHPLNVVNDDWGAVCLQSGTSVNTGERMLHMKYGSVLALRPGFFTSAPRGSYAPDLSEQPDPPGRVLVTPEAVYGPRWDAGRVVVDHVVVLVREPPDWVPPRGPLAALNALRSGTNLISSRHHETFLNGSLILATARDQVREERRYRRLLERVALTWINNYGPVETLVADFESAVLA